MRVEDRTAEEKIARIAERQHGVVTRSQLLDSGLSRAAIARRVSRGALFTAHRGVYRVGHRAPSLLARYMAAVLACGSGAVLAGRAAGYLLGLISGNPPPPSVITPTERRIAGIRTLRSRPGATLEATTFRGIPVTVLSHRPQTKGAGNLRAVLRGDIHVTLSKLEDRFLELLRLAHLPLPITNRPSNGYRSTVAGPPFA